MIPVSRRGLLVAAALLMAVPDGAAAEQPPHSTPAQQGAAGQPKRLGRPYPAGVDATRPPQQPGATRPPQQPGATRPPQQPGATGAAPPRLGRQFPVPAAPLPRREEPDVSVSVVSPQESPVVGRRLRAGNQRRGPGNRGRAAPGMGAGGDGLDDRVPAQ